MRRDLIAAGVTLHLLAIGLQAMPSPSGGMNRAAWADPTVQAEFRIWADRLAVRPDTLEASLWSGAQQWTRARSAALRPFRPYYNYLGTYQSWKMFIAPHVFPTRLMIEVRRPTGWEIAYVERSPEHRWLAQVIGNDRMRSMTFRMGWPHYTTLRADFAAWTAERAATAYPDATQVRISFLKQRTRAPHEVRAGEPLEQHAPIFVTVASVRR